jgi:integrase/recombinase XerD
MNKSASLLVRTKRDGRWRTLALRSFKRLPRFADGEGYYVLFWRAGKRHLSANVGREPDAAQQALRRKCRELEYVAEGGDVPKQQKERKELGTAVSAYLERVHLQRSRRTWQAYRRTLELFQQSCTKKFLDEITKEDMRAFADYCKRIGLDDQTVRNQYLNAVVFFSRHGVYSTDQNGNKSGIGGPKSEWPKATKRRPPRRYTKEELKAFFAACKGRKERDGKWLVFQFFLGSGFRECEVAFLPWTTGIDFELGNACVRRVRLPGKSEYDFTPKDFEERDVELPQRVLDALSKRRKRHPDDFLVFGNPETSKPEGHFLRMLKAIALRAGLNCGHCVGRVAGKSVSCKDHAVCELWTLHRFRKTFASILLMENYPLPYIQRCLGHSDLKTTSLYLADEIERREEMKMGARRSVAFGAYD